MSKEDQEKLIKLLVKEMLEQDEELNEILGSEMIGNAARKATGAVQRGVGIAQGLKQNVKQSWKAATGNEAEAKAALDAKSKIKFDFLDKQSEIVKTDVQNAIKNAIAKANSVAQSSGAPENKELNKQYVSQKMIQGIGVGSSLSDSDVLSNFGSTTTNNAKQQIEKLKQQFLSPGTAASAIGATGTAGVTGATGTAASATGATGTAAGPGATGTAAGPGATGTTASAIGATGTTATGPGATGTAASATGATGTAASATGAAGTAATGPGAAGTAATGPGAAGTAATGPGATGTVPLFKATPESKGDFLGMKLKPALTKSGVKDPDQLMTNYLKMISNQLKANNVKLSEARGDNLNAQLSGFTSKTATGLKQGTQGPVKQGTLTNGSAANIQKGSIDLFGPAILLLKQAGIEQKAAVTAAKQIQDLTSKHLKKYGIDIPQKAARTQKPEQQKPEQQKPEPSKSTTTNDNADKVTAQNKLLNNKNLSLNEIVDLINYLY